MAIPSLELQKGIFSLLSGTYPVFDTVPSVTSYPYVQIGEEVLTMDDTKEKNRTVHNLTLHTYSKGNSSVSAKEVNNFVIDKILNELVVDFFVVEMAQLVMLTTLRESEISETYHHGVLIFEITLKEEGMI